MIDSVFGYTGSLEVTGKNLATIGRFIHRCGLFEDAVSKRIGLLKLEKELEVVNKKKWKSLDDQVTVLSRYCRNYPTPSEVTEEYKRVKAIEVALKKYKRMNGVRDLRNAIAHNPILVSVMGAWQPGPGYVKKFHPKYKDPATGKVKKDPKTGEDIEILSVWSFDEIDQLSEEMLVILSDLGYSPKHAI